MDGGFLDVDVDVVVIMVDFRSRRASSILARRSSIRSTFCSLVCQTTKTLTKQYSNILLTRYQYPPSLLRGLLPCTRRPTGNLGQSTIRTWQAFIATYLYITFNEMSQTQMPCGIPFEADTGHTSSC